MLAENTKSSFSVGGRMDQNLAGPHFNLTSSKDGAPSSVADSAMELRAAMKLNLHPSLRQFSSAVQFCFRDGCMAMAGVLPSYFLKQLTQEAIRNLDGVCSIDNRICVESGNGAEEEQGLAETGLSGRKRILPR